jgi:hypothetical protein
MFLNTFDLLIDNHFSTEWCALLIEPAKKDTERIAQAGNDVTTTTLPDDSKVPVISDHHRRSRLLLTPFHIGKSYVPRSRIAGILAEEDSIRIIVAVASVNDHPIAK